MKKTFILWFILMCGTSVLFSQNLARVKPPRFDKAVEVDVSFVRHINFMGNCAEKYNLNIIVTGDGFRKEWASLTNTVVNPARESNHLVGQAIDINIMNNGTLYNSTRLENFSTLPQPIKDFITECKSFGMRWGGDFLKDKDPVHFDSGLNINNPTEWKRIYDIYQNQPVDLNNIDILDLIDTLYLTNGKSPSELSIKFNSESFTIGMNKWEAFTMKNGYKINCRINSYGFGDLRLDVVNLSPYPILIYWEVNAVNITPLNGYGIMYENGKNGSTFNFSNFRTNGNKPDFYGVKITILKK